MMNQHRSIHDEATASSQPMPIHWHLLLSGNVSKFCNSHSYFQLKHSSISCRNSPSDSIPTKTDFSHLTDCFQNPWEMAVSNFILIVRTNRPPVNCAKTEVSDLSLTRPQLGTWSLLALRQFPLQHHLKSVSQGGITTGATSNMELLTL